MSSSINPDALSLRHILWPLSPTDICDVVHGFIDTFDTFESTSIRITPADDPDLPQWLRSLAVDRSTQGGCSACGTIDRPLWTFKDQSTAMCTTCIDELFLSHEVDPKVEMSRPDLHRSARTLLDRYISCHPNASAENTSPHVESREQAFAVLSQFLYMLAGNSRDTCLQFRIIVSLLVRFRSVGPPDLQPTFAPDDPWDRQPAQPMPGDPSWDIVSTSGPRGGSSQVPATPAQSASSDQVQATDLEMPEIVTDTNPVNTTINVTADASYPDQCPHLIPYKLIRSVDDMVHYMPPVIVPAADRPIIADAFLWAAEKPSRPVVSSTSAIQDLRQAAFRYRLDGDSSAILFARMLDIRLLDGPELRQLADMYLEPNLDLSP